MYYKPFFPSVICKDGARLSCQASEHHYSTPRTNTGPYTAIEVGFPSVTPPETWAEYGDGDGLNSSVFAYVPLELVQEYIDAHGGIDFIRMFNENRASKKVE